MSGQRDMDGLLRAWLDVSAPAGQSNRLLESTLARTGRRRPRPAWMAGLIGEALPRRRQPDRRPIFVVAVALAVLVIAAGAGLQLVYRWNVGSDPTPEPSYGPLNWSGPIRAPRGETVVHELLPSGQELMWPDPRDAAERWVDITAVEASVEGQDHWRLDLAAVPPKAADLDPSETVIAYGLVFDTNGDGTADWEVGINNDAPEAGDLRTWVTDLATGMTEEQIGPPYGYPVEFSHPDEALPDETLSRSMLFTFLGMYPPRDNSARFYAWASVTQAGEVVAWDYAPDVSWLTVVEE